MINSDYSQNMTVSENIIVIHNYSPEWRLLGVDINRAAKQRGK